MKNKNLIIVIVGIVALAIGGGAGFFAGTKYQQSKVSSQRQQFANGNFQREMMGRSGNVQGESAIRGEVISKDNNSITIKMQDNSTKIVVLSSSTTISKSTQGSADDITQGENVMAFGTTNSDGSITAQSVQINPQGFGPRASASPTPQSR